MNSMRDFRRMVLYAAILLVVGIGLWFRPWKSKEIAVGELPAVKTNAVAEVVTSAPPTEVVVDRLIATNTNISDRISLKGKVQSEWK